MINAALNNNYEEARAIHYKLLDLIHLLFAEGNPAGIKEVLAHLDICENDLRLPLVPVSEKLSDKIRKYLVEEEFMS
jgi:4-hydroxy-tetrahydrodipicolinate synthase